jgi:methylenetetrahydrofolate reductase (NADPH)
LFLDVLSHSQVFFPDKETPGLIIHPPPPESDLVITPIDATDTAARSLTHKPAADIDGHENRNNAATWDDFPNGRFSDSTSPAFGITGPWGGPVITVRIYPMHETLPLTQAQNTGAFAQWGNPASVKDLTQIFLRYLHSEIASTPFSPMPLSPESHMILRHLERFTEHGWWTVGSQPAVDGISSSDEVVGWGPPGGYVYQKAFVEFFAPRSDIDMIQDKIKEKGGGWVHYFAGNYEVRLSVDEDRDSIRNGRFARVNFRAIQSEIPKIW